LLLPLATGCAVADSARVKAAGQAGPAPDLSLQSLDGRQVSLSQYRGSVVLINFWATWCPPCKGEIPALEAAYRAHKDRGFVILGVDVGEPGPVVQTFVRRMGISYVVLLDEQERMLVRYGGLGLPMSVLVDRDGIIRERHIGVISEAELQKYLDKHLPDRQAGTP
jgi:peroxiredoxin